MMKKIKIGLLPRIILAIALGIAFGNILPGGLVRIFVTFNGIFSELLGFIIPLIILGLVTPAIADIGKEAGKMLVVTTLIAYGATLFSGFLSYFTGITFFPSMITPGASIEQISEAHDIVPFFTVAIPPVMNVMTSLILAFTLGLGIAHLNTTALKDVCNDFKDIIIKTIQVIILPLLPIYIFGIFLNMTHSGQVMNVLSVFIKIIGVIFLLHIFLLIFQYSIAALFVRRNPFRLLGRMLPAYFTALGTQSSAATIPVTLRQSIKNGVSEDIAGFVIPLCATIHLSGSTLKIVACGYRSIACYITCSSEAIHCNVECYHQGLFAFAEAQHGGKDAQCSHDCATRNTRCSYHCDAQHEDEPGKHREVEGHSLHHHQCQCACHYFQCTTR